MDVLTYPIIKPDRLAEIVSTSWGVKLTEQMIRSPTADIVQSVYSAIILDVLSLDVAQFERDRQPVVSQVAELPEYYYETMQLQMLLYHMGRVAKVARAQHFLMRDLTRPEGPRFIRILSAVVNFKAFSEDEARKDFMHNLQFRSEETAAHHTEQVQDLDELAQEIQEAQLLRNKEQPRVEELRAKLEELEAHVKHDVASRAMSAGADIDRHKATKLEVTAVLKSRTEELELLYRRVEEAKSRLVRSPERVKSRIATLAQSCETEREQIAMLDNKSRALHSKMDVLARLADDVRDVSRDMETISKELADLKKQNSEFERRANEADQKQADLEECRQLLDSNARKQKSASETLERLRATHDARQEAAREKHEDIQARYAALMRNRLADEDKSVALNKEIERLTQEQRAYVDDAQAQIDGLLSETERLQKVIYEYMADMNGRLNLGFYPPPDKPNKRRKKSRANSAQPRQ